jgi:hypothetical protein
MRMWQTIRASVLGRHVHEKAYAALVLSGGYEEAGYHGRFRVKAGDVIFHEQFEAHLDRFPEAGAVVLNLRLPFERSYAPGTAKVADPDSIVRVAERNGRDAVELLFSLVVSGMSQPADWPDELVAALMRNPSRKLSKWGEENGIAPWTLSRGFALVFGVSAETFRARTYLEAVGLFAFPILHPLVKPVCRNQAALGFEGFPERRRGRHGFGSRIDRPKADGGVLRPRGNKSPPHG